MAEQQKRLQDLSDEFQSLQTNLQSIVEARQKLEAQEQENKSVQEEFAQLPEDSNVYKLVGPVLMKQDRSEAVMAVDGRLEYIGKEIKRIEGQITDIQEKSDAKRMEILQIQTQAQQLSQSS